MAEKKRILSSHLDFRREVERSVGDAEDVDYIARKLCGTSYIVSKNVAETPEQIMALTRKFCEEYAPYHRIQQTLQYKLIRPVSGEGWFLYNEDTHAMIKSSEAILKADFNRKEDYLRNSVNVILTYNPRKSNKLYEEDGNTYFNSYQPPFWKRDLHFKQTPVQRSEMPELYTRFFNHLCGENSDSLNFLLDWIAISLQSRNRTFLCTIGEQGIGKGVLSKIISALHGSSNSTNVSFSTITKQFNGLFYGKTFIYLDEVNKVTSEQADKLKKQNDDQIEIERKNVESEVFENYSNICISSNHLNSIHIEPGDRRYSILSLTNKRLETIFTKDEMESMYDNKELLSQLAGALFYRKYDKKNESYAFKSSRALEIMNATAQDWEKWFIDEFCKDYEGEVIKAKDTIEYARDNFRKANISVSTLTGLSKKFDGIFKVLKTDSYKLIDMTGETRKTTDNKRVFCIQINPIAKQVKYDILEDEV